MDNHSNSSQPDIIEQFKSLLQLGDWEQAKRIIEEIIERNPYISTSWFNYGTVLDELKLYSEAARAFEYAFELNNEDFGAEYRMFRSLHLAKEVDQFISKLREACNEDPDFIDLFLEDDDFGPLFEQTPFKELLSEYNKDDRIG